MEKIKVKSIGITRAEGPISLCGIKHVVHRRSDMASWLVEGGFSALSELSGKKECAA